MNDNQNSITTDSHIGDAAACLGPLQPLVSHFLKLDWADQLYRDIRNNHTPKQLAQDFFSCAIRHTGLRCSLPPGDLAHVPRSGPAIAVANHPDGIADGLLFGSILTSLRPDTKIVANHQILACPELADHIIPVRLGGTPEDQRQNFAAVRSMLEHLQNGGLLGMFPAGATSSPSWNHGHPEITDDPWSSSAATLVQHTGAAVVPFFFHGRNSTLYQAVSLFKKTRKLRTALYPREFQRDLKRSHPVSIGSPVSACQLARLPNKASATANLRLRTYLQSHAEKRSTTPKTAGNPSATRLARRRPTRSIRAEIDALPVSAKLVSKVHFDVFLATASQIPETLSEIGRLRERTFRAVGEGTNKPCDTDHFDQHYHHLFLWDRDAEKIAGAYRLAIVDHVLPTHNLEGLYTHRLFQYEKELFSHMAGSIELGRSFITATYQRETLPLSLLWEGIGATVARFPGTRYLFGAVSTSQDYAGLSRELIVSYLTENAFAPRWSRHVKPACPPTTACLRPSERSALLEGVRDIRELSSIIAEIEPDGKGIPVLLKHYLKLDAQVLGFNIDPNFNNVLDALVVVDLLRSNPRALTRFLGKDAVSQRRPQVATPA
ncbi:MAG: lysophospholipid acyltransferase family protein [Verrucomicrobiales bacterium]|nr:lysophospholipid acyltransferase family protein [Verrucomicrobiales bacterium]